MWDCYYHSSNDNKTVDFNEVSLGPGKNLQWEIFLASGNENHSTEYEFSLFGVSVMRAWTRTTKTPN